MTIFRQFTLLTCMLVFANNSYSQDSFPEKCLGTWQGWMKIYKNGHLKDSVEVKLYATKLQNEEGYGWKTQYLSEKFPMVKDYVLKVADAAKNTYFLDEGDGILLSDYAFGNKLYGIFETGGFMLTSSYELISDRLVFEVTSGKQLEEQAGVTSYSVENLQRVVFERNKE